LEFRHPKTYQNSGKKQMLNKSMPQDRRPFDSMSKSRHSAQRDPGFDGRRFDGNFAFKSLRGRLMKRNAANTFLSGISHAEALSMKSSRLIMDPGRANPGNTTTRTNEPPLKISIVFDEDASARSAEVFIRHVASDFPRDTQSFRFDELDPPGPGVAVAQSASNAHILVLAVRDDHLLPSHVESWLGLCMGLRDEHQEGALVALIPESAETADPNSSLLEYLETVAAIGGLAFFPRRQNVLNAFLPDQTRPARRRLSRPALKSPGGFRNPAGKRIAFGD
jgi:hypothetical protein